MVNLAVPFGAYEANCIDFQFSNYSTCNISERRQLIAVSSHLQIITAHFPFDLHK